METVICFQRLNSLCQFGALLRPTFYSMIKQMNTLTVRPVNPEDEDDMARLLDIIESDAASETMDDITGMDEDDIEEWVEDSLISLDEKDHTDWEIVFAVTPVNDTLAPHRNNKLEGFVNFYASQEVTERFKREMNRLNKSVDDSCSIIEVSMAKWPEAPRGQMTIGLCLACIEINSLMSKDNSRSQKTIVAYIDPENIASVKAFEKAGFEKQGRVYYDLDDDLEGLDVDGVDLYTINWSGLREFLAKS